MCCNLDTASGEPRKRPMPWTCLSMEQTLERADCLKTYFTLRPMTGPAFESTRSPYRLRHLRRLPQAMEPGPKNGLFPFTSTWEWRSDLLYQIPELITSSGAIRGKLALENMFAVWTVGRHPPLPQNDAAHRDGHIRPRFWSWLS
jgi:hypothetical protein